MSYLEGINLDAFGRGNRRLIAAIRTNTAITWKHCAGCAGGAAFFWPVVHGWLPAAITGGATLWTLTALVMGQQDTDPAAAEETPGKATAVGAQGDFLALLHRLMPAPGDRVHIAQVAAEWTGDPADTAPVRELCTALGITITRGVRVPGRKPPVSTGIHQAALPPLPDPSPAGPVAVVVAGQHGQPGEQQQQATPTSVPHPSGDPRQWVIPWDDQKTA